ncbi:caspase domain-containing protein [Triangularia verruculosa]|uniref:Caspase domain-containing protein n=1 Tax=Triangularia verruculosa TaxID=2587418 RepID=A0AAN6X5I1_9PEZI|nr:caspase domain-containing protein [Triangularia verruculosa]
MPAKPAKNALLIASPIGGLQGPQNDVDRMTMVLKARGFDVNKCCGKDATRDGIRAAWQALINRSSAGDAVVVFYSGHGGLVEAPRKPETESTPNEDHIAPRQYQFLLPTDFEETSEKDFRGILDVEISQLLQDTTTKTPNVTVILDCCHSGRMARDAIHGNDAIPKQLLKVHHHDIKSWVHGPKQDGRLGGELAVDSNPDAVRIVACTARETAWEYRKDGQWGGIFTEALTSALGEAKGRDVSWSTLLLRVAQLVHLEFPQQNPHAEGPHTRGCFSTKPVSSQAFLVKMEGGIPILHAGRVVGVREGNQYAVMPFGATGIDKGKQIAVATVTVITGFKSGVELDFGPAGGTLPTKGAFAFLSQEALYEWPVLLPPEMPALQEQVDNSRFLRRHSGSKDATHLAEFRYEDGEVVLRTKEGVQIASQQIPEGQNAPVAAFDGIVGAAEVLAKAQHFLRLKCENEQELLTHGLQVEYNAVHQVEDNTAHKGSAAQPIRQDGKGFVREGDKVYFVLRNTGESTIYVSVFNVNVAGRIKLLSESSPNGLQLKAGESCTLGKRLLGHLGLKISWPSGVPGDKAVGEHQSLVVSSAQVDLRHVETTEGGRDRLAEIKSRGPGVRAGGLEEMTYRLASGERRDTGAQGGEYPRYDVIEIPFTILPAVTEGQCIRAEQLPAPESTAEWRILPASPPQSQKGIFGAGLRATQGIPACVWVVNQHSEEIMVVVSKYRPNRLVLGAGLSASSTGAGANYTTTTFLSPATTKILAPSSAGLSLSSAAFPLWTRAGAFGVISIFTGPEKKLFIENDRIPIGATAYFKNEPNLTIVDYAD